MYLESLWDRMVELTEKDIVPRIFDIDTMEI